MTPLEWLQMWAFATGCALLVLLVYLARQAWLKAWRRWRTIFPLDRRDCGVCLHCGHIFAMTNSDAADKRNYCTQTCETRDLYAHFV